MCQHLNRERREFRGREPREEEVNIYQDSEIFESCALAHRMSLVGIKRKNIYIFTKPS